MSNTPNNPNIKYSRPKVRVGLHSTCHEYADVINKHLNIRLKEETKFLISLSRQQSNEEYIQWFNHTEKNNSSLITKEVARLNKNRIKNPIDFYTDEGKFLIGKSLLDKFILTKRNEVIDLRKALGLEYSSCPNKQIILTSGIERSDIFRLFGGPLTLEELKTNYKKLAKHCHSDLGGSDDLMARINGLYEKLTNKWSTYDPANLGISTETLEGVLNTKFKNEALISFLDFC